MKQRSQKKGITIILSLCLTLAVFLTGCGSSNANGGSSSTAGTDTSSGSSTSNTASTAASKDSSGSDTVPIGIVHSLTGTMSISEVAVKNAELMAIDEINKKGGLLGKQLKPIVEDGASDWPTFAEKAKLLLQKYKVPVIFGGWTSASRKAMLPVVEKNNGLLFYPVQYEGMEASPNIFYTGAAPNEQIVPSVNWLLEQGKKKFFLLGSDYVFPRTANKIIKEQLKAKGADVAAEEYTPLGHTDYSTIISKIQQDRPDVILNTLNGDSNVAFFKQLKDAGITPKDIPVMSYSIAEQEIKGIGADNVAGDYVAWNYFESTDTPENKTFVADYKAKYGRNSVTDDPIEAGYFGVYLWAAAVKKADSFDVDKVKTAAKGLTYQAPEGLVKIDGENQHTYKTARIGVVQSDGQIKQVWASDKPVQPDPFLKTYSWYKN